jgi:hypothetical protein
MRRHTNISYIIIISSSRAVWLLGLQWTNLTAFRHYLWLSRKTAMVRFIILGGYYWVVTSFNIHAMSMMVRKAAWISKRLSHLGLTSYHKMSKLQYRLKLVPLDCFTDTYCLRQSLAPGLLVLNYKNYLPYGDITATECRLLDLCRQIL